MRSYHWEKPNSVESLTLRHGDTPALGSREVLVHLKASSLNYRDIMIMEERYGRVPFIPGLVPLSDGAGEIVASDEAVTRFKTGDRVIGNALPRWIAGKITMEALSDQPGATRDGVLSDFAVFHEDALVAMPPHLDFEEAATLPGAAVTAWTALSQVRAGETVLTQGSGGVSLFALQFAKLMGAHVIATTSDAVKAARLKELGADHVIDYCQRPDWHVAVREATRGRGVDHVIEIGGAATISQSIQATALGGQIELVGTLAGAGNLNSAIFSGNIIAIRWASVGSRADFEAMNRAITVHSLKPVVDRIFSFEDAQAAFTHFLSRKHFGKVVIRHD